MSRTPDARPEPDSPPGISLGELTEAFAQAMGAGPEQPPQPVDGESARQAEPVAAEPEPALQDPDDDTCRISPLSILEAMLFVGNREGRSLAAAEAAELMRGVEPEEISLMVRRLNRQYAANGCPYQVVREGDGYRLTLRKAFHPLRKRFYGRIRQARLSQAAVDILAIVAYQQPLTGERIGRLRGKPSSHALSQLVRRGLLRVERADDRRRTAQYYTTDRFLELFGMETIDDLPRSEELDRL